MFLTYGVNEAGDFIHISETASGSRAGLKCPYCGGLLSAKKGEVVSHHFAHLKESCRAVLPDLPYQYDFYVEGLSSNQVKALNLLINAAREPMPEYCKALAPGELYVNWERGHQKSAAYRLWNDGFQRSNALVLMFINRNFFAIQAGNSNICKLTDKARAFRRELSLKEFAVFSAAEFERLYARYEAATTEEDKVTFQIYQKERERLAKTYLYFLHIKAGKEKFYKVGITTRPVEERIKEIRAYLAKQGYAQVEITCPVILDKMGLVESYFKAKFEAFQFAVGTATEYFRFSSTNLKEVNVELHRLSLGTDFHRARIKKGLEESEKKGGRPKDDSVEAFLSKPKSREIAELIAAGKSLREIERTTGASINTVRKVDKLLKGQE